MQKILKNKTQFLFIFFSLLVLLSGAFIRFWRLDSVPPGIQYDEAFNGLNAISANIVHQHQIFYTENYGREGFHINIESFFIWIFGISNMSLRLASAVWGTLAILGFYFLLRQFKFSRAGIILGTFMLAFSFWHLGFSRTAYRAIMVPFLLVWIFYFFFKGLEVKNKNRCFFISAVLLGLGFHTYIAFRIAPLIIIFLAAMLVYMKKDFLRDYWKSALMYFFVSLSIALPMFIYFSSHRQDMIGRTEAVSIFDAPAAILPWNAFKTSLSAHLKAFIVPAEGDPNPRHNYDRQPLLPPVWNFLFLSGIFLSFLEVGKTFRQKRKWHLANLEKEYQPSYLFYPSFLALMTFIIMLVPGILSIEGVPHTLRIIGTIPAVFIFCVLPFEYLAYYIKNFSSSCPIFRNLNSLRMLLWSLSIMTVMIGLMQPYIYFNIWAVDDRTYGGFEKRLYDLGKLVSELPLHANNYLITGYNTAVSKDHKESSFKTTQYIAFNKIEDYQYFRPMDGRNAISCEDPLVVFHDADKWLREQYQTHCPGLKSERMTPQGGEYSFWVIKE